MRIGRYLPGITPDYYRSLSFFDRSCVNEALDVLLDRENGTAGEEDKAETDDRIDEEARRSASRSFDDWHGERGSED